MASGARVQRVADELQKLIVSALRTKVRDPRLQWVSVTEVEVSKDLSYAKVYFSSIQPDADIGQIEKAFIKSSGFFRSYIAKEIRLRVAPQLRFIHDNSLAYGQEMNALIAQARAEDQSFIQEDDAQDQLPESSDNADKAEKRERLR